MTETCTQTHAFYVKPCRLCRRFMVYCWNIFAVKTVLFLKSI